MDKDIGRVPDGAGLSSSTEPCGLGPSRAWARKISDRLSVQAREMLLNHTGEWASSRHDAAPRLGEGGLELLRHGLIEWRSETSALSTLTDAGRSVRDFLRGIAQNQSAKGHRQ